MPRQKPDKVVAKAVRLLGEGKSQSEVAKKCGISLRTLQRWASSEGVTNKQIEKQSDRLVIAANEAVQVVLSDKAVQEQISDLLQYRDAQKFLALEMGSLASRLSALCLQAIEGLEANPSELTPRLLPQVLKAVADLSEKSSNAWARSVGLDDLLERVNNEPHSDN